MNKKTIALLVLESLWTLIAWLVVPVLLLLFARKTDKKTTHYAQDPSIQRYELPKWLKWMETPDELLPGGMYEPTVEKIYKKLGWFLCSWYWIGFRNIGHGITWSCGKEVPRPMTFMSHDELEQYGLFERSKVVLGLRFVWGWKAVADHYNLKVKTVGARWAVPRFTIRLANQDE